MQKHLGGGKKKSKGSTAKADRAKLMRELSTKKDIQRSKTKSRKDTEGRSVIKGSSGASTENVQTSPVISSPIISGPIMTERPLAYADTPIQTVQVRLSLPFTIKYRFVTVKWLLSFPLFVFMIQVLSLSLSFHLTLQILQCEVEILEDLANSLLRELGREALSPEDRVTRREKARSMAEDRKMLP